MHSRPPLPAANVHTHVRVNASTRHIQMEQSSRLKKVGQGSGREEEDLDKALNVWLQLLQPRSPFLHHLVRYHPRLQIHLHLLHHLSIPGPLPPSQTSPTAPSNCSTSSSTSHPYPPFTSSPLQTSGWDPPRTKPTCTNRLRLPPMSTHPSPNQCQASLYLLD